MTDATASPAAAPPAPPPSPSKAPKRKKACNPAAALRRRKAKEERFLNGFDVPVPVCEAGTPFTVDQLRRWNDAVLRHKLHSNLAIHNTAMERCRLGECCCFRPKPGSKRAKAGVPKRHICQKTTAPKFQARVEALDAVAVGDERPVIEALVYRDDAALKVRFADSVSTDAAAVGLVAATGKDRHLLFSTSRFMYQQLLFDIDVDLPLLAISEDVAVSPAFVREQFCPAVAVVLAAWVNSVGFRVDCNGARLDSDVTPDDLLIVVTDGQPKVSLHVHCSDIAAQSTWFKDLFVPGVLRPIIMDKAPQLLSWLREPDSDKVLAKIFDKAPLNGSMFRLLGQTKSAKSGAGRGTPLRRDPATGAFTVEVPMAEAAAECIATNVHRVSSVLLPTEASRAHAAASAPGPVNVIEWSPADVKPRVFSQAGNLPHLSLQWPAYAAETPEEQGILEVAKRAFEQSTGVVPHVFFVTAPPASSAVLDGDDGVISDGDDDGEEEDDGADDDDDPAPEPRRLLAFDPLDAVHGETVLKTFWADETKFVFDDSTESPVADGRKQLLQDAVARSKDGSFYFCPSCVAACGTCSYHGHAHSLYVTKAGAVFLRCVRLRGEDGTAPRRAKFDPTREPSMFQLGLKRFPGFGPEEQGAVNTWWRDKADHGLLPLNATGLRRGHGTGEIVQRFAAEMPVDNLYVGRSGTNFVRVFPSEGGDPKRRVVKPLPSLAPLFAATPARFIEVHGGSNVSCFTSPPPYHASLLEALLLHGDPCPEMRRPRLQYVAYTPVVRPDGTVMSNEGLAAGTPVYCAWPHGEVAHDTPPSPADLKRLLDDVLGLFGRFRYIRKRKDTRLEESACLLWLVSTQCRHLIAGGVMGLLVDAAGKMAGKGTLCETLMLLTLGVVAENIPLSKDPSQPETVTIAEQTFNTAFNSLSTPVLYFENIRDKHKVVSEALESSMTFDSVSFRGYHTQALKTVSSRLAALGNGCDVGVSEGLVRRFDKIVLEAGSTRHVLGGAQGDAHAFRNDLDKLRVACFERTARTVAQLVASWVRSPREAQHALLADFHAAGHKPALSGSLDTPGDVHYDLVRAMLWDAFGRDAGGDGVWYVDPCDVVMEQAMCGAAGMDAHGKVAADAYEAVCALAQATAEVLPSKLREVAGRIAGGSAFTWADLTSLVDASGNPLVQGDVENAPAGPKEATLALVASLAAFKQGMTVRHKQYGRPHVSLAEQVTSRRTNSPDMAVYLDKFCAAEAADGRRVMVRLMQVDMLSNCKAKQFYFDVVDQQ